MRKQNYAVYEQTKKSGFVRGPGKHSFSKSEESGESEKAEKPKKPAKSKPKAKKSAKSAPKPPKKSFTGDEVSEDHAPMPEMADSDPMPEDPGAVMPMHDVTEAGPDGMEEEASPDKPHLLVHMGGGHLYRLKKML